MENLTLQQVADKVTREISKRRENGEPVTIYGLESIIRDNLPGIPVRQERNKIVVGCIYQDVNEPPIEFIAKNKRVQQSGGYTALEVQRVEVSPGAEGITIKELNERRRAADKKRVAETKSCKPFMGALSEVGINLAQYESLRRVQPMDYYYESMLRLYREEQTEEV